MTNVALLKVREENVTVLKPLRQASPAREGFAFEAAVVPVRETEESEVINLDGFRVDTVTAPFVPNGESFRVPPENPDAMRNVYIGKYKQTERNSRYLNSGPSFEIRF